MLDKIKAFLQQAKITALFIIAPILSLFAYILFLRNKTTELQDKLNQTQAEKQLAVVLSKKVKEETEATEAEKSYDEIRKEYLDSVSTNNTDTGSSNKT